MSKKLAALVFAVVSLSGCDQLNQAMGKPTLAESRAIGASCRQVGRALEDCYKDSPKANKAEMYAGWKEMDGYMRDNNIPTMRPSDADTGHGKDEAPAASEAHAASGASATAASAVAGGDTHAAKGEEKAKAAKH